MRKERLIVYFNDGEVTDIRRVWKEIAKLYGMEKADAQDVIDVLRPRQEKLRMVTNEHLP